MNASRKTSPLRWWLLAPCGVLLTALIVSAQTPTPAAPAAAATTVEDEEEGDDTIVLSPFTVESTARGYFAENTLAGSRLNTNVADLAASISVVTKTQLEDTASVDINDVFRYEVNTEGSLTYTPTVQSLRNDGVVDVNAGFTQGGSGAPQTNATANRVRGLGSPTPSINFYVSVPNLPMDSYNIQSLEISRGPNSMLFGLGSPAGIVNQSWAQAALNRDSYNVTARFDNRGSVRVSGSFNQSIIDDYLAIYGAAVYDDRRFERKPSYDLTRRQYLALTFKPFQRTTLRASYENYLNNNRRPNTISPRDNVSEWRSFGRPVYDPTTLMVTKLDTGQQIGPFVMQAGSPQIAQTRAYIESRPNYNPALWNTARTAYNGVNIWGEAALTNVNSALYVPGIFFVNNTRPTMQIAGGELQNWFMPTATRYIQNFGTTVSPAANPGVYPSEASIWANPVTAAAYNQRFTASTPSSQNGGNIGSYLYPSVTDKSIYDWSEVNLLQMNFGRDETLTANVEFEQQVTDDLFFSAGWFKQSFESLTNYTVSQLNITTLFVDTNQKLPDGRPNPYFGTPYVEDFDPDQFLNTTDDQQFRALLAYTPDFTNNDGWSRWLGRHQMVGLISRQETDRTLVRRRLHFVGGDEVANRTIRWLQNPNNNADGTPTGWSYANTSQRRTYYLASPDDAEGVVTGSSGEWNHQNYSGPIQAYNFDTRTWQSVNMNTAFVDRRDSTGASERVLDSISAGVTSYLWKDRIIATMGVRHDEVKNRGTSIGQLQLQNGVNDPSNPALPNPALFTNGWFNTDLALNRWNRWFYNEKTTDTTGVVFKPFTGWGAIESRAERGSLFHEFLRDFGVSFNRSNNFNPPDGPQTDMFREPLPNPSGEGEDIGVQFSLFDKKLFARLTYFEASNEFERTAPGTAFSRFNGMDTNYFRNWARNIVLINNGYNPSSENFGVVGPTGMTQAQDQALWPQVEQIWKQAYIYYDGIPINATRSADAEGYELQVTYSPTSNLRLRLTGSDTKTIYSNVLKEFDAWQAVRLPVWQAARAADYLLPQYQHLATYTTFTGRQVDLTNFLSSYGYHSDIQPDNVNGWSNVQRYYDIAVAPQVTFSRQLEGQVAPGQRRYRGSLIGTYDFRSGALSGFSFGGGQRWEDKAIIGYYGYASDPLLPNFVNTADLERPIYDKDRWYTDLWVSYARKIWDDKVRMKLQLNVNNVFEDGGLRPVGVNFDGSYTNYRIIDSRQFLLTTSFDF